MARKIKDTPEEGRRSRGARAIELGSLARKGSGHFDESSGSVRYLESYERSGERGGSDTYSYEEGNRTDHGN